MTAPCWLSLLRAIPLTMNRATIKALLLDGPIFTAKLDICSFIDEIELVKTLIRECLFIALSTCHVFLLLPFPANMAPTSIAAMRMVISILFNHPSDLHVFICLTEQNYLSKAQKQYNCSYLWCYIASMTRRAKKIPNVPVSNNFPGRSNHKKISILFNNCQNKK